jgi:hypothetical protein
MASLAVAFHAAEATTLPTASGFERPERNASAPYPRVSERPEHLGASANAFKLVTPAAWSDSTICVRWSRCSHQRALGELCERQGAPSERNRSASIREGPTCGRFSRWRPFLARARL